MIIKRFAVGELLTNCYVVEDESTSDAVIIDPGADDARITSYIDGKELNIRYILLTHGHFDHVLGCGALSAKYGAEVAMSATDAAVFYDINREFGDVSVLNNVKPTLLLSDGDKISFGDVSLTVMSSPGHTPGGICYIAPNDIFSGDTLFNSSVGRTDFYGGSFSELQKSIRKIFSYSDETVVHPGHGFATTVGQEKHDNPFCSEN